MATITLPIGAKILDGEYTIERHLGSGITGGVYEATARDGDAVALKVIEVGPHTAGCAAMEWRATHRVRSAGKLPSTA
jgi:hypothetical protein